MSRKRLKFFLSGILVGAVTLAFSGCPDDRSGSYRPAIRPPGYSSPGTPSQEQRTGRLVRKRVLVKDWDYDEDGNRHWGDYHYEYRWVRE
jgi:hypothetical protein